MAAQIKCAKREPCPSEDVCHIRIPPAVLAEAMDQANNPSRVVCGQPFPGEQPPVTCCR